jgi:hypothetical protein
MISTVLRNGTLIGIALFLLAKRLLWCGTIASSGMSLASLFSTEITQLPGQFV